MKKSVILFLFSAFFANSHYACTNFLVGKKASADGSTIISYNADSYGCYGVMQYFPAARHPKGTMRKVYDWESNKYRGEIAEATETYNVVGNINEHQLCIGETTFGGREELVDTAGLLDYGSLIYITLQRAKNAREAIQTMTSLVAEYGYASEGETFSIADPNEVWVMEMVGKGINGRGAVWVAVRIPDDCVSAHANQSRIHKFMHYDKKDCLYSKDIVSFARQKGLYSGSDEDFDFANTYCPLDFGGARYCEARVWSFYNRWAQEDMGTYLNYAAGYDLNAAPMPLYVKPKKKLSVADVENAMRDQYEDTPLRMDNDPGMGTYQSPYRPRPLSWEYDGKKYFNERPTGTQQTSFTFVAQMRSWLPNAIGGVIWFGHDDANMIAYTPVYCCATEVPDCYTKQFGDDVTFSLKSAFWVCNWVANMVYPRYSLLFPDVKKQREALEKSYFDKQSEIEGEAQKLLAKAPQKAVEYLTQYSVNTAHTMLDTWIKLGTFLIVKYNDTVVKPEKDGQFLRTPEGLGAPVKAVGYPEETRRRIVEQTGNRFLVPTP
ncbi:MAG: C69 family dipeptidase [Bacteroidaceae bacterium]|nr:C69 family dipeptidase [Bacteroidaceae bacterium]